MTAEPLTLFEVPHTVEAKAQTTGAQRRRIRRGRCDAPPRAASATSPSASAAPARASEASSCLPPTLDVVTAGSLLGVGRTVAYRMVRHGTWPTHVVHVGRKIVIPTVPLLQFLGVGDGLHPAVQLPTGPACVGRRESAHRAMLITKQLREVIDGVNV